MPNGKEAKGTKITLKIAKKAIRMTLDGHRRLNLSNMGITTFPKCLFKLTIFDELDLSRNLIRKLPDRIGKFSTLRWLDLHSNKLESVPESISSLVLLTHLNLSNNFLTSEGLPSNLGSLASLKCLNLGMNKLDNLPPTLASIDSLQEIGLYDNLFLDLPDFLHAMKNLTKLNTKRNPFTYVQENELETSEAEEEMYLVCENSLCRPCLKRCKEQRKRFTGEEVIEVIQEKRIRTYAGMMVPNSVAAVNQDVWRIREVRKNQKSCQN